MLLFCVNQTYASDYQYKILDPKYNPAAERLINGELQTLEPVQQTNKQKGFNFLQFLAIFAAISFPVFVLTFAWKSFRNLVDSVPGCATDSSQNQSIGNIKIVEKHNEEETLNSYGLEQIFGNFIANKSNENDSDELVAEKKLELTTQLPRTTGVKSVVTSSDTSDTNIPEKLLGSISSQFEKTAVATLPVEKKNPMLLNTAPLTKNKGFCLVEYDKKYSLIGYINTQVFFLNQFDSIKSCEIRPRLTERNEGKDRYLVRLGSYKGLVEVDDEKMDLLINL